MATAGTFVAVLGAGEWNEVFLLQPTLPGGCHWICVTTDGENGMTRFYTAVHLVEGAVKPASDIGPNRTYPGLDNNQVNWMVENSSDFNAWCPNNEDKTEFEKMIASMSKWPGIPEQCYLPAGGPSNKFQDLAMLVASWQNVQLLQSGCFAIIKRGNFWHEIFLCLDTSSPVISPGWLCRTSSYTKDKVWTAVQFVQGSYCVAEMSGNDRLYPGVSSGRINWLTTPESFYQALWCPTIPEGQALLEEAKAVCAQLGAIQPNFYVTSGGPQDCVPSLEDIYQNRVAPAPGKFVLIKLASHWQEALLCVAVNDRQWIACCSALNEAYQGIDNYWTLLTLMEDQCFVLPGTGVDRHDAASCAQSVMVMKKVSNPPEDSIWVPTPQRIRKALSDAAAVLTNIQSGKLVLAEIEDENVLPALKATGY